MRRRRARGAAARETGQDRDVLSARFALVAYALSAGLSTLAPRCTARRPLLLSARPPPPGDTGPGSGGPAREMREICCCDTAVGYQRHGPDTYNLATLRCSAKWMHTSRGPLSGVLSRLRALNVGPSASRAAHPLPAARALPQQSHTSSSTAALAGFPLDVRASDGGARGPRGRA